MERGWATSRSRSRGERDRSKNRLGNWRKEGEGEGGWFGFLLCLATMSVNLGPGVLFQHNGREKSSIIRRWPTEEREGQQKEPERCTMVYAHISLGRIFRKLCSSMSLLLKSVRGKMEFQIVCLCTRFLLKV